jgi:hypothetical protein
MLGDGAIKKFAARRCPRKVRAATRAALTKGAWRHGRLDLTGGDLFGTMGMFTGAAVLYLTGTRVRLLGHQAAEIVLFCLLFAIAVFAVIAAVYP